MKKRRRRALRAGLARKCSMEEIRLDWATYRGKGADAPNEIHKH